MRFHAQLHPTVYRRPAVTLIEIVVVLSIFMVLAALSFFIFSAAKQFNDTMGDNTKAAIAQVNQGNRNWGSRRNPVNPPTLPNPRSQINQALLARLRWMPRAPSFRAAPARSSADRAHTGASRLANLDDSGTVSTGNNSSGVALSFGPTGRGLLSILRPSSDAFLRGSLAAAPAGNELLAAAYRNSSAYLEESFVAAPAGNDLVWRAYPSSSAFLLHSNPGATQAIYLDFTGTYSIAGTGWNALFNAGAPFTMPAWSMDGNRAAFSTVEQDKIILMWRQVAEDFMPFNVDVTTEDPGAAALNFTSPGQTKWGVRVIIGPFPGSVVSNTPMVWPPSGGIAFLGSYKGPTDNICFVNNGDLSPNPESSLPDSVSHETGHTLGLEHDGIGTPPPFSTYYGGHGAGATSWGPIMGAPFGKNLTQWSMNTYPSADNPEDDLQIIASAANGFGYRPDDHGDTMSTATTVNGPLQGTIPTTYGIIEKSTDVDYFQIFADPGPINIQINPLFVGPNLDVQADLLDSSGAILLSSNPVNQINATLAMTVSYSGAYFVRVRGTGLAPVLPAGYPSYGSLGNYRITGTVTPFTPPGASFKVINPVRWTYNPTTATYDGYISIANITHSSFTGTFQFILTFPDGIQARSSSGTQSGNEFTIDFTGTMSRNRPLQCFFRVSNPLGLPLRTGNNTYLTQIVVGQ